MAELKITLKHSAIGRPQNQRTIVRALGLGRADSAVTKSANEAVRGMANIISYLMGVKGVQSLQICNRRLLKEMPDL